MSKPGKMSFNASWSMAVGGMVGGGIFSVLGVVIATAGGWAWLSFLLAGIIALISANSYSRLSVKYNKDGGVFTYLRKVDQKGIAGSLAWILIMGYTLTISVYASTFGHYVAHVFSAGLWLQRVLSFVVISGLTFVNLRGVSESSIVEIITVWGKLIVLLGLAIIGLAHWDPGQLNAGLTPKPWSSALVGAATIFMAYEGFQLLAYDYHDIHKPKKNLPMVTMSAVLSVIVIYVLVTFGSTMLVGASMLVEKKEVALSVAGQAALGTTGLILVTIAAAFSTGSAVNATLFSTGRLMESVSKKKDLPDLLGSHNKREVPYLAILIIAAIAILLALFGSLAELVDAASLIFLITFGTVNWLAFRKKIRFYPVSLVGAVGSLIAIVMSVIEQIQDRPVPLIIILSLIVFFFLARPWFLRNAKGD